ncbi:MAG: methionyl-tRNA formyltransferase [Flavobacteriaceae bacterium]|nr:methionyl-tRNA formyltransferase [Flavobacteriaceae bacterium]
MKRDLRIVFMGTPDFAAGILKTLVEDNYNIVGVVTAPDKPAGRGRKLHESAVKQYAKSQNLNILQPTNLKSEIFINDLKALKVNLQIVVAFRMLPKVIWQLPTYGTFNLHASLLPQYRGAAPINWAIINGDKTTGVTTFFIEEKIDTGEIILQEEIAIEPNDTAGTLHDKLMQLGSIVTLKTVKLIENNKVVTVAQTSNDLKEAPKIFSETCRINWNDSLGNIQNFIRGLSPYPAAWTILHQNNQEINVKIFKSYLEFSSHSLKNGAIIVSNKTLKIVVKNGYLVVEELQLAGKKKMDIQSLLNGFQIAETAYFS